MDVDVLERHPAGEMHRHHDHPGDPEEDDVEARDQHGRGQEQVLLDRLGRPADGRERKLRGRIPGVQHVGVAREAAAVAGGRGLLPRFFFAARHEDLAVLAIPGGDLVAPPELARDAPVLDVLHPLVPRVDPLVRHEAHLASVDGRHGLLGDGATIAPRLGHGHEPLVGEHRLDDLAGAPAARHHQLVLLGLDQQAQGLEIGHHALASLEAVQPAVGRRRVVVDRGVECEHADHRQAVALADRVVVVVVRRRHLDHAGAEFAVHVAVGDDRDCAAAQRQRDLPAHQRCIPFVFRVHHHRGVAQHGFRTRRGHDQRARTIGQRIADVPQEAVFLGAFDLEVGDGGFQHRVPAHQALAAVDQPVLVQPHEGLVDHRGLCGVHREVLARPVHRVADAAHLAGDDAAGLFLPGPHVLEELLAADGVARQALLLQLALHHDLRGDAGMVGARQPQRVEATHAVVARERIHDRVVEAVAHVQRARHIGRR